MALGRQRAVFSHPQDTSLIVKVMRPDVVEKRFNAKGRWYKRLPRTRHYISYLREIREYIVMCARMQKDFPIVRVHGITQTDKGLGLVCDKAIGNDGHIAPTLHQCWTLYEGREAERLQERFNTMCRAIWDNNLIVGDFHAGNVVYGKDSSSELKCMVVDGFGEKNVIPIRSTSKHINRHFLRKSFRRMQVELSALVAEKSKDTQA